MNVQLIDITQVDKQTDSYRPSTFTEFVGQEDSKKILQAAIASAQVSNAALEHILLSGQSGYGKTTLAQIIATHMGANIKIITGYAISKPSEMVSILNSLGEYDILFIDEIHRLRSNVEEVLYIAMEDYCIDMVMPEGGSVRIPLAPFTLIGATTKMEKLSAPLKNRFIYKFHFHEYSPQEQEAIIARYMHQHQIVLESTSLLNEIVGYLSHVPRDITNTCIQLRDYLIAHHGEKDRKLSQTRRKAFRQRSKLKKGGLTALHQKYMHILSEQNGLPVGLKTLAVKLGMSEKAVEEDIEPLLFKLSKIDKTSRGRILLEGSLLP